MNIPLHGRENDKLPALQKRKYPCIRESGASKKKISELYCKTANNLEGGGLSVHSTFNNTQYTIIHFPAMNISLRGSENDRLPALHKQRYLCIRASGASEKIFQFLIAKLQNNCEFLLVH